MIDSVKKPSQIQSGITRFSSTVQKPPETKPQPSPAYTFQISEASLLALQELHETPEQTIQEALGEDLKAQRLLAGENTTTIPVKEQNPQTPQIQSHIPPPLRMRSSVER